MKKLYLLVFIFCAAFGYKAKGQECEWLTATTGGTFESGGAKTGDITTDNSDNTIVAACFGNNGGGDNFYIGNTLFSKGQSLGEGMLIKYNEAGNLVWALQSTSRRNGHCTFFDVETDDLDNIYVLAICRDTVDFGNNVKSTTSSSSNSLKIVKYDSTGKAIWVTTVAEAIGMSAIIADAYSSAKLFMSPQNTLLVAFSFRNTIRFSGTFTKVSNGGLDICVAKFDSAGRYLSSTHFGGNGDERLSEISTDAKGNTYVLGTSLADFTFANTLLQGSGEILIKMDAALQPIKGIKYIKTVNQGLRVSSLAVRKNGYCVVAGWFTNTVDFNGVTLTENHTGSNRGNNFIVYYDPNLNGIWGRTDSLKTSSISRPTISAVTIRNDYIYLGGKSWPINKGDVKFGPFELPSTNSANNLLIVKVDTLGNFLWAFGSTTGNHHGRYSVGGITTDINGNCIVCGQTWKSPVSVFNKTDSTGINGYSLYTAKITDYSITRGNVYPGPYCAGDSIKIPYTKIGTYKPGNEFIAQLSDSAGNFDGLNGTELGRKADTAAGVVGGTLPLFNVATNNRYRIRILSTKPGVQSFYRLDTLRLLIYSKDTANAGPDTTLCYGQSIRLGTTGGSKWIWSPSVFMPDAADTSNRQPLVKPGSTQEYRIIISDSSGCGVTDTDYVKIYVRTPLTVSVPDTFILCKGRVAAINAKAAGGIPSQYNFEWSIATDSNHAVFSTVPGISVNPDSTTQYRVILSDNCSLNDTAFVTIIPDSGLQIRPLADTTICFGNSVILDGHAFTCDTTAVKYAWDNGLGSGPVKIVSPQVTTTYKILAYDSINGSKDSVSIKITVLPKLQLGITNDTTLCNGNSLALKAIPAGGLPSAYKILWKEDGGSWTDTSFAPVISPSVTASYTAILSDGCSVDRDTQKVTVTIRPSLKLSVNNDTVICVGETVDLEAIPKGGLASQYKIHWSDNSGGSDTNFKVVISPAKTTTYTAVLTDNCTPQADSAKVTITVRPPLLLKVSPDTVICHDGIVSLRAFASGGFPSQYKLVWTEDTSPWTDSNYSVTRKPLVNTTYKAVLNDNCTLNPDTQKVKVTVRLPLALNISGPDTTCLGQPVILTTTLSGGDSLKRSISWSTDTKPFISNNPSITDTPMVFTTYTASLTDGCSPPVQAVHTVAVVATPKAAFGISDTVGCAPIPVALTDNSTQHDPRLNTWNIPQAGIVLEPTPQPQLYHNTGFYRFSLSVSNKWGCKDSITKYQRITVHPNPKAGFTVKPDIKQSGRELQLLNTSWNATSGEWFTGDGTSLYQNGVRDTVYTYKEGGDYTISLITRNDWGCRDTISANIHVFDPLHCIIPNAFTPNGDGINNTFAPVCSGLASYTLTIFNRWGQVIQSCENCYWDGSYAGQQVSPGVYMYLLKVHAESGLEETVYGTVNVIR